MIIRHHKLSANKLNNLKGNGHIFEVCIFKTESLRNKTLINNNKRIVSVIKISQVVFKKVLKKMKGEWLHCLTSKRTTKLQKLKQHMSKTQTQRLWKRIENLEINSNVNWSWTEQSRTCTGWRAHFINDGENVVPHTEAVF